MAGVSHPDSLQVESDPQFERRVWVFERIGWAVIALLLLATVAGVFGSSGLIPPATARSADGLEVRYPRFQRHSARMELALTIPAQQETVQVWLSRSYIESYAIQRISPEPESAESSAERVIYTFRAHTPGRPAAVVFLLEPSRYGSLTGTAGLGEDGAPLRFWQFIYP